MLPRLRCLRQASRDAFITIILDRCINNVKVRLSPTARVLAESDAGV